MQTAAQSSYTQDTHNTRESYKLTHTAAGALTHTTEAQHTSWHAALLSIEAPTACAVLHPAHPMLHLTAHTRLKQHRHCLLVSTHIHTHGHHSDEAAHQLSAAHTAWHAATAVKRSKRTAERGPCAPAPPAQPVPQRRRRRRRQAPQQQASLLACRARARHAFARQGLVSNPTARTATLWAKAAHHTLQQNVPNKVSWTACFC
jgi:hypothetical protein